MKWNKIKQFWFQGKIFGLRYKSGSVLAGMEAGMLITAGAIVLFDNSLIGTFDLIYGFFILLPLSYYQRQMSERNEV